MRGARLVRRVLEIGCARDSVPLEPLRGSTRIRVGVLVHNRPEYLAPCLSSLACAVRSSNVPVDVTLFDDGSTDRTTLELVDRAIRENSEWKAVRRDISGGHWAAAHQWAVNQLLAGSSGGDLLGTIDSDVVLRQEWINQFIVWASAIRAPGGRVPVYYSAFNSSDLAFHSPVVLRGTGATCYLERHRMGGAHIFAFSQDVPLLGSFPHSRRVFGKVLPLFDDESIMTRRLLRRGLRNASVIHSLCEHLGHESILNASRPVPVASGVYGLNQSSANWAEPFGVSEIATPGLLQQQSAALADIEPQHPMVLVVRVLPGRLSLLKECLQGLESNLRDVLQERIVICDPSDQEFCARVIAQLSSMDIRLIVQCLESQSIADCEPIRDRLARGIDVLTTDADCILIRTLRVRAGSEYVVFVRERTSFDRVDGAVVEDGQPVWAVADAPIRLLTSHPNGKRTRVYRYAFCREIDVVHEVDLGGRVFPGDPTQFLCLGPSRAGMDARPAWWEAARWAASTRKE